MPRKSKASTPKPLTATQRLDGQYLMLGQLAKRVDGNNRTNAGIFLSIWKRLEALEKARERRETLLEDFGTALLVASLDERVEELEAMKTNTRNGLGLAEEAIRDLRGRIVALEQNITAPPAPRVSLWNRVRAWWNKINADWVSDEETWPVMETPPKGNPPAKPDSSPMPRTLDVILPITWGHMNFSCECRQCKATAEVNRLAREVADNEAAYHTTTSKEEEERLCVGYDELLDAYRASLAAEKGAK